MTPGPFHPFAFTIVEHPRFFVLWTVMVLFSISCHEYAHAWVADQEGDPTARNLGHLTLNPLKQMGLFSIIMFLFIGFAWGAVPVLPKNFRRRLSRIYVAGAGPLMNGIQAVVFLILYALVARGDPFLDTNVQEAFMQLFYIGILVNVLGGFFNLFPIPPLDGWDVWSTLFPPLSRIPAKTQNLMQIVGIIFLILGIGYLWELAGIVSDAAVTLTNSPIVDLFAYQS